MLFLSEIGYHVSAGDTPGYHVSAGDTPGYHVSAGDTPGYHVSAGDTPGYHVSAGDTPGYHVSAGDTPLYISFKRRGSWKKRARRDPCKINRRCRVIFVFFQHMKRTSNHTMSAVNGQSSYGADFYRRI